MKTFDDVVIFIVFFQFFYKNLLLKKIKEFS